MQMIGLTSFRPPLAATILLITSFSASAQSLLRLDGSTGVAPLAAALAKSYGGKNSGERFEIGKGLGTKARIEALKVGDIDIALASHGLRIAELKASGMDVTEIARTPVVFATNGNVGISSISADQVCGIYKGDITNWKEIGGRDHPIVALIRPDSEVDTEVVREQVSCFKSLKAPDHVKVMPRAGDMATELGKTSGSIGMTTTTLVEQSGGKITALSLDGIAPEERNVAGGKYRLVREAYLVTKSPSTREVGRFLEYIASSEGADTIRKNGAIPVGR
jgi:phosphate transport system substrate-binding protein